MKINEIVQKGKNDGPKDREKTWAPPNVRKG
jgi:hypothetical protein